MEIPQTFSIENLSDIKINQYDKIEGAFQNFVIDLFCQTLNRSTCGFPLEGQDGSIDGIIDNEEKWTDKHINEFSLSAFIEAKYHYASKLGLSKNIIQSWDAVQKRLENNLKQQTNPDDLSEKYKPWYSDKPKTYLYCISCEYPDLQTKRKLEDKIKKFFKSFKHHSFLSYLADLNIEIYAWQHLRQLLKEAPALAQEWFIESIPPKFETFEQFEQRRTKGKLRFHQFLSSKFLPFYESNIDSVYHSVNLFHEIKKFNKDGLLIIGMGGVGKTRLSYELCNLGIKEGWQVFVFSEMDLDFNEVRKIIKPNTNYMFLFDYIEKINMDTDEWEKGLSLLRQRCRNKHINSNFIFLGTCRKTSYDANNDLLNSFFNIVELKYKIDEISRINGFG